jgi:type IV pilus assembly protein PilF
MTRTKSLLQRCSASSVLLLMAWALSGLGLASLQGCASTTTVTQSPASPSTVASTPLRRDVVTESDEPENRKRAKIRVELALGYFEQGKTAVALDEVKLALLADPQFADAYTLRGLVYLRLGDMRVAEDSFRQALSLNPNDSNAAHNYGWLMCQERRYADAQRMFTQALSNPLYGDQGRTYLTQGICQARDGKDAESERSLSKAFELDAGNPVAGYNLATLLFRRGDFSRAQFYLKRLNASEFANEETLWLGVKTEMRLNNRENANDLGRQLLRKHPNSRQARSYERQAFNE